MRLSLYLPDIARRLSPRPEKDFTEGDLIFIALGVYHTMEVFDDNSIVFNILLRKIHIFTDVYSADEGEQSVK